ncbi:MAG: hypothetical protein AVDCRST_MAG67-3875 [uncultured Solirubrobacteraceae bacterium]|uniref:Uncharacterized protein n=1 Tax=uncultured Solirubrobacteraceae bacterium TaxID=1162706 RepID=A0A6J4TIS8_9ACTN|nr:MAG: hypothetical protein AVDCRST_MAG67-3875 [uncultured Solirubrobacteraceae bacterium]
MPDSHIEPAADRCAAAAPALTPSPGDVRLHRAACVPLRPRRPATAAPSGLAPSPRDARQLTIGD